MQLLFIQALIDPMEKCKQIINMFMPFWGDLCVIIGINYLMKRKFKTVKIKGFKEH